MANSRNPESCPAIAEQQRQRLTVLRWDDEKKIGLVADALHCTYKVSLKDLGEDCQGRLYVGEDVAGVVVDWKTATDFCVEVYSHDRPNHIESVGPCPDADAWGENLGTNHSDMGLRGGKPHDGRFSHPQLHSEGKEPKDAFAGLDKLDQILTEQIEELSLEQRKLMSHLIKK